jgi:ATP adenylyltransferase
VQEDECMYCVNSDQLKSLMTPIMALSSAVVYLYTKDSNFPGRCVVALDTHETELFALNPKKRCDFVESINAVAKAVKAATRCDKINYAIYGDTMSHLHVHIVPKHRNGADWGKPFTMNRGDSAVEMTLREIDEWKKKVTSSIE